MESNDMSLDGKCIRMHYAALMLKVLVERIPSEGESYPPITYGELAKAVNFLEYPGYRDNECWREKAEGGWHGCISEILARMGELLGEHSNESVPNIQHLVIKQAASYSEEQERESMRVVEFGKPEWRTLAMNVMDAALKEWRARLVRTP